jgi:hypothetical protein
MAAGPALAIAADAIYTQINCSPVLDETLAACPQLFDTVSDDRGTYSSFGNFERSSDSSGLHKRAAENL